ncbi:hypothetical protein BX616_002349 [Lobosporangium transversale]|uniref:Uncharacterized protein n=1 Tax=Lobosporangium transversale TaxID=64571 RepID=A0A1Y2H252_9FUNG|nr:hypothetical protein BCR41DRAFT_66555 [Lobosporangium transversale]KAF9916946.1 hypothetical protein BX616_002349 [Lobosporangium transversale]ORZ28094.1 hypothetical protein BCR41DRAFT_66555 [Lobosporangium transversale]|eukprot:XP_021885779.1 hypothetical protein BCR41DRAFT_66555 [Lobosporangium transversale]
MFKHVYPPWHKPVQRCLFVIAAVLCITLPVAYGKHHSISSKTLGAVLGVFFGLWLIFSLIARFLIPSPVVESSLPIYTHSPIRTPVVLHSPNRSDAQPAAPAIRLHPPPSSDASLSPSLPPIPSAVVKGPRFTLPESTSTDDSSNSLMPSRAQHNVTFQTRPRGNTADSTNSQVYPTFAVYRQAQHGNFEAFAQRVKRAFAVSQAQQQLLKEDEDRRQQLELEHRKELQQDHGLQARPSNTRTRSSSSILNPFPSSATTGSSNNKNNINATGTRSRSASAASMIGDIAEKIKNGSFFRRPTIIPLATNAATAMASHEGDSSVSPDKKRNDNNLKICEPSEVEAIGESGSSSMIEIKATSSEENHPQTGSDPDRVRCRSNEQEADSDAIDTKV